MFVGGEAKREPFIPKPGELEEGKMGKCEDLNKSAMPKF